MPVNLNSIILDFYNKKESTNKDVKLLLALNTIFIREVETFISVKYSDQLFRCPVHLSIGQEAIAAGVSFQLKNTDKVISTHRSHAHYLAKGGDLEQMIAELMGLPSGCCKGRGGSMHLLDIQVGFLSSVPIVGSSLPIAAGVSFAQKLKKINDITVSFIGDATFETGQFHESLNFISTHQLPILIVYENNGYSTYSPLSDRQPKKKNLKQIINGYGIEFVSSSGDDVFQVRDLAKELVSKTRLSQPIFVELDTFRRYEHCGPNLDDHLGYRPESEIKSYEKRDPISIILMKKELNQYLPLLEDFKHFVNKKLEDIYDNLQEANHDYRLSELDALN